MITDRRFAIVLGINDYESKPLDFCVNDATAVAKILEDKCFFEKKDIYLIKSSKNEPIKDISGHFDRAINEISKDIVAQKDSIFFFFAGHGKYQFENSGLQFHDSFIEIGNIFDKINELHPKYQCYVIDACESGGKVLTRGIDNDDLIEKYISKSSGTLFMYAATENESAKEFEKIKHGLFTYYFLSAINNDKIYDDEGILTPNRIQDYIARETSKESNFKQTPVIENRTIGYYPFAFNKHALEKEKSEEVSKPREFIPENPIEKVYFPEVPPKIRNQIFENLKPKVDEIFESIKSQINDVDYIISTGDTLSLFDSAVETSLTDSIVNQSIKEKILAINDLFSSTREEIKPNPLLGAFSMIEALMNKSQPKYRYYNIIKSGYDGIMIHSIDLKSNKIENVSCGVTIIVYQALFGIGLAKSSFYLDYSGYTDSQIKGPFTSIEAFKVHKDTIDNICASISNELEYFVGMTKDWNDKRKRMIQEFDNKSK